MRVFNLIWFGQLVSLIGSAVTVFGLGVWVFDTTGSVTYFSTVVLAASLPGVLALPAAGALVDRWDRRRTMLLSDAVAVVVPAAVGLAHHAGVLVMWHVYALVAVSSVCTAFQWPALSALVPEIVPPNELSRANGRIGLADGMGRLVGAALGGALYTVIGLSGLVALDVLTFCVAVGTLIVAGRWRAADGTGAPGRAHAAEEDGTGAAEDGPGPRRSVRRDVAEGWRFIRARRGLLGLLVFFAVTNLAVELVVVLVPPLVLSIGTPAQLGTVEAVGWAGMLLVGFYLSLRRAPTRRVAAILAITSVNGLLVLACGVHPSPWVIAAALFGVLGGYSVINVVTATLWQLKTPREMQGRVFAVRRAIAWSTGPVAYGLAGPLVELVARPLVSSGGALETTVGRITGTGADIALVFLGAGLLLLAAVAVTTARPRVIRLEQEVPDALTATETPDHATNHTKEETTHGA
ncbi:MFS transporter [Streptomyces sp. HK10]|uniref:MFS transporter n=1 Tax=Streptomyces sp. HK10 TaxID=3373255 RepID=UPI003748B840